MGRHRGADQVPRHIFRVALGDEDRSVARPRLVDLTNATYVITISTTNSTERYYRDAEGWVKESSRGRVFRATAEQVLNHVLPALAGVKPGLTIRVEHRE